MVEPTQRNSTSSVTAGAGPHASTSTRPSGRLRAWPARARPLLRALAIEHTLDPSRDDAATRDHAGRIPDRPGGCNVQLRDPRRLLFTPRRHRRAGAPGLSRHRVRRRCGSAAAHRATGFGRKRTPRQAGAGPRRSVRDPRGPARNRRPDSRQSHALRQHGRAAEVLPRRHRPACGPRVRSPASRQPCSPPPARCMAGRSRRCCR